jgi:hypothetical protein
MIIKSMSRKEPSFSQLLAYVSRDASDTRYELRHNVLGRDLETMTAEMEDNAKLLHRRKNGVVMYHEIISITRARSISEDMQKELLREVVLDYVRQRAPQCLVFGALHHDQGRQLHYHLVISANPYGVRNRHRLTKKEFRDIQVGIERRVLALHPELEQSLSIGKKAKPRALSQPGIELQRRTGQTPRKQGLKDRLTAIFAVATDKDDLFVRLTDARLELYARGKSISIRDLSNDRNHRLGTLGVADAFAAMSTRFDQKSTEAAPIASRQQVKPPSPAATPDMPAIPKPASPSKAQEEPVDLFQLALQGIGAVADVLSVTRDTGAPLDQQRQDVVRAVQKVTTGPAKAEPASVPSIEQLPETEPPLTDAERIAAERLDEIDALREEQDRQIGDQNAPQMRR